MKSTQIPIYLVPPVLVAIVTGVDDPLGKAPGVTVLKNVYPFVAEAQPEGLLMPPIFTFVIFTTVQVEVGGVQ